MRMLNYISRRTVGAWRRRGGQGQGAQLTGDRAAYRPQPRPVGCGLVVCFAVLDRGERANGP